MKHLDFHTLLDKYTPDELASILCEELDKFNIPYTVDGSAEFSFAPLSQDDFSTIVFNSNWKINDSVVKPLVQSVKYQAQQSYPQDSTFITVSGLQSNSRSIDYSWNSLCNLSLVS